MYHLFILMHLLSTFAAWSMLMFKAILNFWNENWIIKKATKQKSPSFLRMHSDLHKYVHG